MREPIISGDAVKDFPVAPYFIVSKVPVSKLVQKLRSKTPYDPSLIRHEIELRTEPESSVEQSVSLLSLINRFDSRATVYDAEGGVWIFSVQHSFKIGGRLQRLIALLFFNRKYLVSISWTRVGEYELEELRDLVAGLIEDDRDVPAVFRSKKEFLDQLSKVRTFEGIVRLCMLLARRQ